MKNNDENDNSEKINKINKINVNIATRIKTFFRENNELLFCSNNKIVCYNFLTGYIIRSFKIFANPIINFKVIENNQVTLLFLFLLCLII